MGFIAPAGTPINLADIAAGLARAESGDATDILEATLRGLSETDACWTLSSGRAAMVVALSVMRRLADTTRDQVVVPAYTCYSVAAAVIRAGLRPLLCDINPNTLSLDPDRLAQIDFRHVLAVISANLYGLPNELTEIETVARRNGAFMLDDSAQSLGARIDGRPVGGFGDAGLYSFDKGKNMPTIQGGAIVSRNPDFIREMNSFVASVPAAAPMTTLLTAAKLVPYSILLRPAFYDLARRLPGLGLGRTVYETEYPITRYSRTLARVAVRLSARLPEFNAVRIRNALRVVDALRDVAGVTAIEPLDGAEPVYLRLPIRAGSSARRDAIIDALQTAGIGATGSYPNALIDVPEIKAAMVTSSDQCAGARAVADTIITIPTHAYCPSDFAGRVRATIGSTLS